MPAKRTYQAQHTPETPTIPGALPLDRGVAVYYRQSSMKQVGNISTDMQQIDLPRYVKSLGWREDQISLIDEDEGVSGAKRIDERKGMSRLYNLIITAGIGTVAVQAEDRLFRDETQIQVNVFIDACVKSNVRVITPYFKYNFADKYEGSYHRLLFRMRAEQAADYLNSYVRGRLMAAKERMLLQGMWMGGNINLGYMVDDRKNLSSGIPNPQWRKFEPFQPCAEVVVKIFETFIEHGGNLRATRQHIFEHGPHFPDFDDPSFRFLVSPGYIWDKPVRMLKRGHVYAPGSITLANMLTNPVYLGHWMHKGQVVVWNNHPPIISEELFYKAFNYLSPYTLEGNPNPDYAPRLGRIHSTKKKEENPPTGIYVGLVGTYHEEKWRAATISWRKAIQNYAYVCTYMDLSDSFHTLWSRHCQYFDNALTEMLHKKLKKTFEADVWNDVFASAREDFDTERRILLHQLSSVEQKMQAVINNTSFIQSQSFLEALEREYTNLSEEKARLESKLANLAAREKQQDSLMELAKQVQYILASWDELDIDTKRNVAQSFISRIVITTIGKHKPVIAEILWKDNTSDTVHIAYRLDESITWFAEEVETLTALIDEQADQVTIAAALPNRNWHAIRLKAYEIIGKRNFHISPKPIRDEEKYEDYLARLERDGEKANRTSGNRWTKDELEVLEELVAQRATQLEIAAALPVRSWEAIRKKIVKLHGDSSMVTETGQLEDGERISEYLKRNPEAAAAMELSFLDYSSPRTRWKTPSRQRPAWEQAAPAWRPG
jgi:hypothetical protein